jgi:hypothetical protein
MAKKETKKTKKKDAAAQALVARRWRKTTREERVRIARWVAAHGAGRPRSRALRCPCGTMTLRLARIRADRTAPGSDISPGAAFTAHLRGETLLI